MANGTKVTKGTKTINKGKNLKETEFRIIRTLLDLKMSTAKIQEVTGRSYPTINRVTRCKTWNDYELLRDKESKRHNDKYRPKTDIPTEAKEVAKVVSKTPEAILNLTRSKDSFNDELLHTLKRIAIAQEKLVDAWEAHPKTKRGFLG